MVMANLKQVCIMIVQLFENYKARNNDLKLSQDYHSQLHFLISKNLHFMNSDHEYIMIFDVGTLWC